MPSAVSSSIAGIPAAVAGTLIITLGRSMRDHRSTACSRGSRICRAVCWTWRRACCVPRTFGRDVLAARPVLPTCADRRDPGGRLLLRTYILFHDCTPGSFLPTKRANLWVGRLLAQWHAREA